MPINFAQRALNAETSKPSADTFMRKIWRYILTYNVNRLVSFVTAVELQTYISLPKTHYIGFSVKFSNLIIKRMNIKFFTKL